jgi:hypothetical protein
MKFQGFDDYWTPFPGGQGSAPACAMSLSDDFLDPHVNVRK